MSDPTDQPLVIFTPSGKRGRVAPGTSVLAAARQLEKEVLPLETGVVPA